MFSVGCAQLGHFMRGQVDLYDVDGGKLTKEPSVKQINYSFLTHWCMGNLSCSGGWGIGSFDGMYKYDQFGLFLLSNYCVFLCSPIFNHRNGIQLGI